METLVKRKKHGGSAPIFQSDPAPQHQPAGRGTGNTAAPHFCRTPSLRRIRDSKAKQTGRGVC